MFAFKPFGGSVVIFIPAWRIDMGNWGVGLELSHNLQSAENPFIIDSRDDNDVSKPELRVESFTGPQHFHDLVQFRHPAERQVAVRQEHPGTFLCPHLYHSAK